MATQITETTIPEEARATAALAIANVRNAGPLSAFQTFNRAHALVVNWHALACVYHDTRQVAVTTLAGSMLTDRTYRAMRDAW